jgi:hypothetical protein
MIQPHRGTDGNQFSHNFKNTFLSEAELAKPSREFGVEVTEHTKRQLDGITYSKTNQPYGRLVRSLGTEEATYIKYTPKQHDEDGTAKTRVVK